MFSRVILRRIDPVAAAGRRGDDIEHQPLSPRDVEPSTEPEMAEQSQARMSRLGMRRPTIPSRFRFSSSTQATSVAGSEWPTTSATRVSRSNTHPAPRPNSDHYAEEDDDDHDDLNSAMHRQSSLPSRYSVVVDLPSTRLHLPGLQRTWTQGSNGPPTSRPAEVVQPERPPLSPACRPHTPPPPRPPTPPYPVHVREPERARVIALGASSTRLGSQEADELYPVGDTRSRGQFRPTDPAEAQLAEMVEDGRRRRQRSGSDRSHRQRDRDDAARRARRRQHGGERLDSGDERRLRKPPKHFMFCIPWIKSRKMRSQIVQTFVSGMFLVLLTSVYLALSLTNNITNHEFSILLILIVLFSSIFFCQSIIRLCLLIFRPKPPTDHRQMLPTAFGPGGYAIPRQPIRVVLARDEEAAGIESETTKIRPPAYGLWRESVRVDPNRIYWQRNMEAPEPLPEEHEMDDPSSSEGSVATSDGRRNQPRPPSYASEDGVAYVVEARPRSIAPTAMLPPHTGTEIVPMPTRVASASPLPVHPSEAGRIATPPTW